MSQIIRIRKRPIEVSAIQWTNNEAEIRDFVKDSSLISFKEDNRLEVYNIDAQCWVNIPMFHFIIKGIKGEFYPISEELLNRTYQEVE